MKKVVLLPLFLIGFLLGCQSSTTSVRGQMYPTEVKGMNSSEQFQASQWLRMALASWEVGDYPMMGHFSRLLIEHYPDTYYSKEAEKLLKKGSSSTMNEIREHKRNNPGLYIK